MRILTTLPQNDLNEVSAAAAEAEAAGFDGVLTMENRHDPFLAHAVAATATKRIELGTAVAPSPSRAARWWWRTLAGTCRPPRRAASRSASGRRSARHNEKRLLGAVDRAGAAAARICAGAARDLAKLGDRRAAALRGRALHLHPDDAELHACLHGPAHGARHPRGGRRLFAPPLGRWARTGCGSTASARGPYLEEICLPRIAEGMARTGRKRESSR